MYLSQMKLNLRSRDVRHELADRYELHRTLMQGFPAMLSDDERVLYRVETLRGASYSQVILQSVYEPDWTQVDKFEGHYLYELPKVRPLSLRIAVGRRLPFRLQANPTVKRDGKRHGLYDDASLMNWLERKGNQHGFEVNMLDTRINKLGKVMGKSRKQVWEAVQFDGVLMVQDVNLFEQAIRQGIGSGKAFGFGLLSVPHG